MDHYKITREEAKGLILGANEGGTDFGAMPPGMDLSGVLGGGQTIRVTTDDGTQRWYQIYEFPAGSGQFVAYQFNNREQVEQMLGTDFEFSARTGSWFDQNIVSEGNILDIANVPGTWQGFLDEIIKDEALLAGINDPTLIGRIAADPEMQNIMVLATIGDWSDTQILAEQRNTSFWKDVLYPGIENLYDRTANPEQAWVDYRANLAPALRQLGYEVDADGTYNSKIEEMLDGQIDSQTFLSQVPTFIQAQQNVEFANTLDKWAERDLGRTIDFNDWFDLVAGEGLPELEAVAEKAQLAWQAQNAQVGVTDFQVEDIAGRTQLTQAEMVRTFSEMSRALLALGDQHLARGDLTRDDLLSAFAGADPASGKSIEGVRQKVAKLARENDLFDEEKLQFFTGFTAAGTPEKPGLKSLAPEGA